MSTAGASSALSRKVYEAILGDLLSGRLAPGDVLNRREVAARLKVSVAPVLEALLQLESEGFLETRPRKGTVVRAVKTEDLLGQLLVREALECQGARLYCGEPVRKAAEVLQKQALALESLRPYTLRYWQAEVDFHTALMELAGSSFLLREYRRVMRLGLFFNLNRLAAHVDASTRDSHIELLERLSLDDPDAAEQAIRAHVRSGKPFVADRGRGTEL